MAMKYFLPQPSKPVTIEPLNYADIEPWDNKYDTLRDAIIYSASIPWDAICTTGVPEPPKNYAAELAKIQLEAKAEMLKLKQEAFDEWKRVLDAETKERQEKERMAEMSMLAPKWGQKVAWSSEELLERQKSLLTNSCEMEAMFEVIAKVVSRATGKTYPIEQISFGANFGTPVDEKNNSQTISINIRTPVQLRVMLTRAVVDGKLRWSTEVSYNENTPVVATDRFIDASKLSGVVKTTATVDVSKKDKRRKVCL